jgi:hypothetical protein
MDRSKRMPAPFTRTWMRPTARVLAAGAAATSAWAAAQVASPGSNECRRALEALQAEESRVIAARQGGAPATLDDVKGLRAAAARTCLGGTGQAPPPTARLQPPAEMPRPAPPAPGAVAPLPAPPARISPMPPPPPAQAQAERPVVITHCDPSGCWANDGIWRPRVGATLGGPRGLCTTQGTLVSCP